MRGCHFGFLFRMVTSGCFLSLERSVFVLAPRSMPPRCTLKKNGPVLFLDGRWLSFSKNKYQFLCSFEIAKCPSLRVLWSSDRWHTTSTRGRLAAGPGLFQSLWWWGQGWPGNPVHGRDAVDNHSTSSKRSWLVSSPKQKAFNMMLDR